MILRSYRAFRAVPFVRDIAALQMGKVIYVGLTLISSIAFARILGLQLYGIYAVVVSLVSTIKAFVNVGQAPALQIFFAEQWGRRDCAGMARVLRNFIQLSFLTSLVLVVLAILSPWIAQALYDDAGIGRYARLLFLFHAVDIVNGGVLLILQAVRKIRLRIVMEQSAVAALTAFSIILLLLGQGVGGVIAGQLAGSILFAFLSLTVYRAAARELGLPGLRELWNIPARETLPYARQGLLFSLDKNIGNLYPSGLFFVLSLVAPVSTVGVARIAFQLSNLPQSFLLPQVSELATTVLATMAGSIAALRKNAAKVIKHSLFFHLLISTAAMAVMPFLIILLYGRAYAEAIPLTLAIILLSLLSPLTIINSPLLRLFRKIHYSLIVVVITMLAMWSCIYFLAGILTPPGAFLAAYFLGQVLPLSLTGYVFLVLLRRDR